MAIVQGVCLFGIAHAQSPLRLVQTSPLAVQPFAEARRRLAPTVHDTSLDRSSRLLLLNSWQHLVHTTLRCLENVAVCPMQWPQLDLFSSHARWMELSVGLTGYNSLTAAG